MWTLAEGILDTSQIRGELGHLGGIWGIWRHLGGIWKHLEASGRHLEASGGIWEGGHVGGIWEASSGTPIWGPYFIDFLIKFTIFLSPDISRGKPADGRRMARGWPPLSLSLIHI